eukprot:6206258-Amphidinium_carterae.1
MELTIRKCANIASTLNTKEVQEMAKAMKIMKWYLKEREMSIAIDEATVAVMIQYSCDGTPVRTRTP